MYSSRLRFQNSFEGQTSIEFEIKGCLGTYELETTLS